MKFEIQTLIFLTALILGACTGKPTGSNAATADATDVGASPLGTAAPNENAPLYPNWANAIAPPYPNAAIGMLINVGEYQFQSTDDPATVVAWYKSHVSAPWEKDAANETWHATVDAVRISISKNTLTSGDAARIKSMIYLTHH